jgi:ParB family transcriptional regulator, chromosome partitioning protein
MSQKKPTLGRGLADLLGHTLRPLNPVSVAVPVAGGKPANGTTPATGTAAPVPGSAPPRSAANAATGTAGATGGVPYAPHAPPALSPGASASGTHPAAPDAAPANDPAAEHPQGSAAPANDGPATSASGANPHTTGALPAKAPHAAEDAAANSASLTPGDELARIPVDLLQKGKYQPRVDMRQETLQELADSIKAQGVIQPIVVRPVGVPGIGESQRYEIIAGERRWRAAQMAGLTEIPAVVRRIPDEAAIAVALIENIQRENLNPLEEARALERLISEFELTHQEAADAVGRSRSGVTNLLRLLELAPEVCDRVERREIEMGHARAIGALSTRKQQVEVATLVAQKGLSVRDTEALVRRMQAPGATANATEAQENGRDPNVLRLEQELADKLGAKVAIQHSTAGKGKLVVNYNSLDELDGILAHIK